MAHRSLDIVLEEVRRARERQLKHFDGLDSKAGVVLGFSGALVALSGSAAAPVGPVARLAGGIAALAALLAFFPRDFPVLDPRALRDLYGSAEPAFITRHLLDAEVEMGDVAAGMIRKKSFRLKAALISLCLSVILLSATALVP